MKTMTESQDHIDFEHLKRYVGDDPELTAEVFGLFKNQVDLWSGSFVTDLDDESWSMMAHSMKGTSRAIGAMGLADKFEQAEALLGDGNRPGARAVLLEKIEDGVSAIMIEISRWEYRQTILKMKSEDP